MDKKRKSEVNAATQPKPKMKKCDNQALPLLVLSAFTCYQNDLLAITDWNWVPAKTFLSITKIVNWISDNFEVSSELGRRYKLEHNQLR